MHTGAVPQAEPGSGYAEVRKGAYSSCCGPFPSPSEKPGIEVCSCETETNVIAGPDCGDLSTVTLTLALTANAAPRFKVLHAFKCGTDGCGSYAGVSLDAAGNVYSAPLGGANNAGIIVKLTRLAGGRWNYQVLHTLTYSEGDVPFGGVALDAAGNIYGTASGGGSHDFGTVFELMPGGGTPWSASVLYNFCSGGGGYCTDGADPFDAPILDKAGKLYGTTRDGGANGGGEAFELASGSAGWTETVLYSFAAYNGDGFHSWASLIFDAAGNLYGTTEEGGTACNGVNCGTVFELSPARAASGVRPCSIVSMGRMVRARMRGWSSMLPATSMARLSTARETATRWAAARCSS